MSTILGINYYFHDSSACLVVDGQLIVALEEERFLRKKHTGDFPELAINRCLEIAGIGYSEVDHIATSIRPSHQWFAKCIHGLKRPHRALSFINHEIVRGSAKVRQLNRFVREREKATGHKPAINPVLHHNAHAAGSFYVSPYDEAAILSLDGSGEWACGWSGVGRGTTVEAYDENLFPNSLGSVYEAVTQFCGFIPLCDEGKTMGLAPMGDSNRFIDKARSIVRLSGDGQLRVDLDYFNFQYWAYQRCSAKFYQTFGSPRLPHAEFEDHHRDVAAAFQRVLEERSLELAVALRERSRCRHLVIAGGVALNSVMNGHLLRQAGFDDVYIMPAAGDNGSSIGAAYVVYHERLGGPRGFVHDNPFLGTEYSDDAIEQLLQNSKLDYSRSDDVATAAASLLASGNIIGWFQGRMEIGPRALGARSILANPADRRMKEKINSQVKFREAYRPFAPSTTVEGCNQYFDIDVEAPFMLKVCDVRPDKRELLPSITHVDGSARVQTVRKEINPLYHKLITRLGELTGVPVVLNTSFNIQGEPVVESPRDAIRCFFSTGLDALVIGSFVLQKNPVQSRQDIKKKRSDPVSVCEMCG